MSSDLESLARDAAAWMKSRSRETQAEVFLSQGEERSLSRREGERDGVEASESAGAGVRVARDGRVGFAAAGGAGLAEIKELYERALEQLPHAEPDPRRALPGPQAPAGDDALGATLWDDALFASPWDAVEARLRETEAAAQAQPHVAKVMRVEYAENRGTVVIAGTSGLFAVERGGSASVALVVAAEDGPEVQLGEGYRAARRASDLGFAAVGREAGGRASSLLGARRAKAGRQPVLFEPWVAGEFLELLAEVLSADEVQGGRSLLAGKLGQRIASPLVTLRDDPRLPGGLGSSRFDDEGLPTRDKAMIKAGVLSEFFYDAFSAARDGLASNGCAYRDSYAGLPGPGASNLYLAPGPLTREALIAGTKSGLLVAEVLGMHMVDPVSGAFSVGVSGLSIEKGRLARPVKGAMLSGNLLDLLARVDGVANDLTFQGSLGSPTFRVSALDVA
ncbi:MAG: TldD/PmbA family protein [Elusimicrobiota bacterium]|nr:TldD/PmbA family protein [Elusimicrobiota bacterium]